MQPEYAMNRKKTTILYNSDTVIMQKNIFWTKKFLACNNRHVALFMLQKKCVLGLGIITDFNMKSMTILNSHIETHCVPLGGLAFMKI